ncbi:MAG: type secretory pathway, component ExeA (predicted ATPase) [Proteobacteria bacterium]|nr:type secretory pathway, component ExeA (predicted ATPase) [Pseudomonadota bacterium]
MYCDHFGLQQAPFRITPQVEYFYAGAQRGPLLQALLFAIEHDEGIIRISGEVGIGKTMLCRMLIEQLPATTLVIYITNPSLNPAELIATVAHELEIDTTGDHGLLRKIEHRLIGLHGQGRRVIAIIDEAHAMPRESLDQIRLLSNLEIGPRKLMQIVLFGQPELDEILEERAMRSLRERITQSFILTPLDRQQIRDYLRFRLRAAGYKGPDLFSDNVVKLMARASQGLIRRVNIIADKTLLAAFAENTHSITAQHVTAAIQDAHYRHPPPIRTVLICLGIGALLVGAMLFSWQQWPSTTKTQGTNVPPTGLASPLQRPQTSEEPLVAPPPPSPLSERYAPIPEQLGPQARARLVASRADMDHISDQQWFLQLRSIPASNAPTLEHFIPSASKAIDPAQLRLFVVKNDPKQTIGVIYGNYPSAQAAYADLARLPAWIKAGGAFARPYKALRQEKTKATANAAASAPSNGT